MEVCDRVLARDNEVTIRWVPAHSRVEGNEQADSYAKAAARRTAPCNDEEVPEGS
jgi:ribonuclease HI